ncbi:MAG: substrate-binding domain-containing protein, partial [Oscillospiraceae bacterium]
MKKFIKTLAMVAVIGLSFCGCANTAKPNEKPHIGISIPNADHNWLDAVDYYANQAGTNYDVNCDIRKAGDANEQAKQVEELIKQKCDVIILLPTDNSDIAAKKVIEAKIPLINFDRKVEVDSTVYLSGDNTGIGRNAAEYFNKVLNGKGNVVIINQPTSGTVNTQRIGAFKEKLKEYPELVLLEEYSVNSYTKANGKTVMNEILKKNSQIDAVFTADDELTLGALEAINEAKRTEIKAICGGGGAKELFNQMRNSKIAIASPQYSPSMISECVKIANDMVR